MLSKLQHWQFYLTNDLSARITMQLQLYNSPPCLHDIMLHFSLLWLVVGLSCCIQSADLSSTTPQTQESQFKLSNYAMLIKCGSRFCQGIAYFLHKIFSESYFSASFSCNMRKVANRQLPTKHRYVSLLWLVVGPYNCLQGHFGLWILVSALGNQNLIERFQTNSCLRSPPPCPPWYPGRIYSKFPLTTCWLHSPTTSVLTPGDPVLLSSCGPTLNEGDSQCWNL